jgi:hypothetical protein
MILFSGLKMYKAIAGGDLKRVTELLDQGVSPNVTADSYYGRPLQWAVENKQPEIAQLLMARGAKHDDVNVGGARFYSWSLFTYALHKGYIGTAEILRQSFGDYLNIQDKQGYTPLARMAEQGNIEAIKYLLKQGADTTIKTNDNRTPYFLAQKEGRQDVVDLLAPYYVSPVEKAPEVTEQEEGWKKLADDRIAYVTVEKDIGYKITEIFNFTVRERTKICLNLKTEKDVVETIGFDAMLDKGGLEIALAELQKQGGKPDPGSVTGMYKAPRMPGSPS